jgi:hypothetical protein
VRVANTDRPSGAWAMPARAKRWAGAPVKSAPATRTAPSVGATRPVASRATVVLPTPLAPSRATASPGSTASETSNTAWNGP